MSLKKIIETTEALNFVPLFDDNPLFYNTDEEKTFNRTIRGMSIPLYVSSGLS